MAAGPAIEARWGKKAVELADCPEVWDLEADYLAQALTNYVMVLSPEMIILGGGVMHQEQLFPLIRKNADYLYQWLCDNRRTGGSGALCSTCVTA
mgnify:CR=1 FL=1